MLFSSLVFLFFFLPAILLVYYLTPKKGRNTVLLIFSIIFYAWGGVSYTAILVLSMLFNFLFARRIARKIDHKKRWLIIGIVFNLLVLVTFKYLAFFIENINGLAWLFSNDFEPFEAIKIVLPLGISFFTFQQMSMLWDIYREPEGRNVQFVDTALYISFFPQLVAGPIVRYDDIIGQIKSRVESIDLINSGIQRFILGLFKKIVIANSCAVIVDSIMINDGSVLSTPAAWLGVIAYAFQIYFDFSGYSDMAIGLGRMFGFKILENFNFPYISRSIREFWRRWHISLSTWFRDYLYIPLGGNKHGVSKTYRNLFIVFLLTGFWHGATWSFVFWGIFHGLFIIIERLGFAKILDRLPSVISWGYTMLIVLIGWVFFRIEEFPDALTYVAKMFGIGEEGQLMATSFLDAERILILLIALIISTPIWKKIKDKIGQGFSNSTYYVLGKNFILILFFLYSVVIINSGSYNPFIYFRF
jgi:alginate O-acetyltransferase complex protein AlgI